MNTLQTALVTSAVRARVAEWLEYDPDTDADALLDAINVAVPDAQVVMLSLVRAVGEAEAAADGVSERIAALAERKRRYAAKADTFRALLFSVLDAMGQRKWSHPEFTVSITPGRAGVVITDPAAIPDQFVRIKKEPDKTAIGCALQNGPVSGAELRNGSPTLSIRTK